MRPALALYAEYLDGNSSEELARAHGLRHKTVLMMLAGARLTLNRPAPHLLPGEARRFRPRRNRIMAGERARELARREREISIN